MSVTSFSVSRSIRSAQSGAPAKLSSRTVEAARNPRRMSAGCKIVERSDIAEPGCAFGRVPAAEEPDQADAGRRPHVEDAEDVGRRLVDPLRPVFIEPAADPRAAQGGEHLALALLLQPLVGMQDVVARRLVRQRRPGHQAEPRVRRRHVDDGGLDLERPGRIDRPGVRPIVGVAPLDQRRQHADIRRLDAGAILGAEETVIEVADHLFERIGRDLLRSPRRSAGSPGRCRTSARLRSHAPGRGRITSRKPSRAEVLQLRDERFGAMPAIERRQFALRHLQPPQELLEVERLGRPGGKIRAGRLRSPRCTPSCPAPSASPAASGRGLRARAPATGWSACRRGAPCAVRPDRPRRTCTPADRSRPRGRAPGGRSPATSCRYAPRWIAGSASW